MKSVRHLAHRDINRWISQNYKIDEIRTFYKGIGVRTADTWVVRFEFLESKETSRLNRALGLHKINK